MADREESEPLLKVDEVLCKERRRYTTRHWGVLLFACLLLFGNYYCYDIPASLNVPMKEWLGSGYQEWQWQINLLYSVYSLPNVFLPVFGGILVDMLGLRIMLILFSTLCCFGQAVFSIGLAGKRFPAMVAGRLIFGLGGESLEVAQAKVTTDWFHGRGLAFALGMNVAFARIATAINDNLSPVLSSWVDTAFASWVGFIVCSLSMLSALGLIWLNSNSSRQKGGIESNFVALLDEEGAVSGDDNSQDSADSGLEEDEEIHLRQILLFPRRFWVLCLCTVCMYGAASPFFHVCTDFFMDNWGLDLQEAGMLMSIPDILAAVFSPVFGYIVDKIGRRGTLLPVAGALLIITHSLLTFTNLYPAYAMSLLGLAYALFAAVLWPCVPYLVRMEQIATGFGVLTISLNIALSLFPLVVATVRSSSTSEAHKGGNWDSVGYFFICQSVCGTLCALLLRYLDHKYGDNILETTARYAPLPSADDASVNGSDNGSKGANEEDNLTLEIPDEGKMQLRGRSAERGSPSKSPQRRPHRRMLDDEELVVVKILGQANTILVPKTFVSVNSEELRARRTRTRSAGPLRRRTVFPRPNSARPRSTSPKRNLRST